MEYNNYKHKDAGSDKYGNDRLKLAIYLRDNILCNIEQPWFIENGTLLGAWRNNKFIPQDDDFDIAILINNNDEIQTIFNILKKLLPKQYDCKIVDTYSTKIEVYEPSFGKYNLLGPKYNNAEYHYVIVDLQFYKKINDTHYEVMYYIEPSKIIINENIILPLKSIKLENEQFNTPNNIEQFLICHYSSLDKNAKYCSKTGKYNL